MEFSELIIGYQFSGEVVDKKAFGYFIKCPDLEKDLLLPIQRARGSKIKIGDKLDFIVTRIDEINGEADVVIKPDLDTLEKKDKKEREPKATTLPIDTESFKYTIVVTNKDLKLSGYREQAYYRKKNSDCFEDLNTVGRKRYFKVNADEFSKVSRNKVGDIYSKLTDALRLRKVSSSKEILYTTCLSRNESGEYYTDAAIVGNDLFFLKALDDGSFEYTSEAGSIDTYRNIRGQRIKLITFSKPETKTDSHETNSVQSSDALMTFVDAIKRAIADGAESAIYNRDINFPEGKYTVSITIYKCDD